MEKEDKSKSNLLPMTRVKKKQSRVVPISIQEYSLKRMSSDANSHVKSVEELGKSANDTFASLKRFPAIRNINATTTTTQSSPNVSPKVQQVQSHSRKVPYKERFRSNPNNRKLDAQPSETYFNSDSLWKRTQNKFD